MATTTHEDTKAYWVTTISNLAAPTVAEINAGTDLSAFIPVSGINTGGTQNRASLPMLGNSKVAERLGTRSVSPTVTFTRHTTSGTDTAWNLFTHKLAGHLVVSRFGGTVATGLRVEVYKGEASEGQPMASADNEIQQFTVELALEDWNKKAVVA